MCVVLFQQWPTYNNNRSTWLMIEIFFLTNKFICNDKDLLFLWLKIFTFKKKKSLGSSFGVLKEVWWCTLLICGCSHVPRSCSVLSSRTGVMAGALDRSLPSFGVSWWSHRSRLVGLLIILLGLDLVSNLLTLKVEG